MVNKVSSQLFTLYFILITISATWTSPVPCTQEVNCKLPDCFCPGKRAPLGLNRKQIPQMVMFSFNDAITEQVLPYYKDLFHNDRLNPNGCPASATFYVSHNWTDYRIVQDFYLAGHEIAVHSVTHRMPQEYWVYATYETLEEEMVGQRSNIMKDARVPGEDIVGMRMPYIELAGDTQMQFMQDSGFQYDATMMTGPHYDGGLFPFTMDFPPSFPYTCSNYNCPKGMFPGVWEIPLNRWYDNNGQPCAMTDTCQTPFQNKQEVLSYLWRNFYRHYNGNRSPVGVNLMAAWFGRRHHFDALMEFIGMLSLLEDVYLVTGKQAIEWMKNPKAVDDIKDFKPWQTSCEKRTLLVKSAEILKLDGTFPQEDDIETTNSVNVNDAKMADDGDAYEDDVLELKAILYDDKDPEEHTAEQSDVKQEELLESGQGTVVHRIVKKDGSNSEIEIKGDNKDEVEVETGDGDEGYETPDENGLEQVANDDKNIDQDEAADENGLDQEAKSENMDRGEAAAENGLEQEVKYDEDKEQDNKSQVVIKQNIQMLRKGQDDMVRTEDEVDSANMDVTDVEKSDVQENGLIGTVDDSTEGIANVKDNDIARSKGGDVLVPEDDNIKDEVPNTVPEPESQPLLPKIEQSEEKIEDMEIPGKQGPEEIQSAVVDQEEELTRKDVNLGSNTQTIPSEEMVQNEKERVDMQSAKNEVEERKTTEEAADITDVKLEVQTQVEKQAKVGLQDTVVPEETVQGHEVVASRNEMEDNSAQAVNEDKETSSDSTGGNIPQVDVKDAKALPLEETDDSPEGSEKQEQEEDKKVSENSQVPQKEEDVLKDNALTKDSNEYGASGKIDLKDIYSLNEIIDPVETIEDNRYQVNSNKEVVDDKESPQTQTDAKPGTKMYSYSNVKTHEINDKGEAVIQLNISKDEEIRRQEKHLNKSLPKSLRIVINLSDDGVQVNGG